MLGIGKKKVVAAALIALSKNFGSGKGKYSTTTNGKDIFSAEEVALSSPKYSKLSYVEDFIPKFTTGYLDSFGCGVVLVGERIETSALPANFKKNAKKLVWDGVGFCWEENGRYFEGAEYLLANDEGIYAL